MYMYNSSDHNMNEHKTYGGMTIISPTITSKSNLKFVNNTWISPLWQGIVSNSKVVFLLKL